MSDYRRAERRLKAVPSGRLAPAGARVVIISPNVPDVAGVIRDVRIEPYLRPYVIACDDGTTRHASAYDLAYESDAGRTLLAPRPAD